MTTVELAHDMPQLCSWYIDACRFAADEPPQRSRLHRHQNSSKLSGYSIVQNPQSPVALREDRIVLLPGGALTQKEVPGNLRTVRWRFTVGPKSGVQIRSSNNSGPVNLSVGAVLDFGYNSGSASEISNSGSEEAIFLRSPSLADDIGGKFIDMLEHLGSILKWLILITGGIVATVFGLLVLLVSFKILQETWSLLFSDDTYRVILKDAGATATLVGVLITGLFGFSGIILTSTLTARRARKQSDESDKKSRELQKTIAQEMDSRIERFAQAFERYHIETLKAILGGRDDTVHSNERTHSPALTPAEEGARKSTSVGAD